MRCRRLSAQKCLRHNRFSLRFRCSKVITLSNEKSDFYSSTPELGGGKNQQLGVDILGQKAVVPQSLFTAFLRGTGILYSPFGNLPADVDRIAFSAFRIRFSASEYTYNIPPKIERKSHCAATTFCGLNARVRASENRWQTTCLRCYAFTSRFVSRTMAIRRNTVRKTAQLRKKPQIPPAITSSVRLEFIPRIMRE